MVNKKSPVRKKASKNKKKSLSEESLHLAFGLASLSSSKMNKLLKEVYKEGKALKKDHEKVYKQLIIKGEKEYNNVLKSVEKALKKGIKTAGLKNKKKANIIIKIKRKASPKKALKKEKN